jgi:DNA-binding transcriptional LysR family regulator
MEGANFSDLFAFMMVAREQSFTRAAAQMGISQSSLSRTIRALEARLGLVLLTRTTRSVSLTDAGRKVLAAVAPRFEEIHQDLESISDLKGRPGGVVRITAVDFAANAYVWPRLKPLLRSYPDIRVELINDYGLANIVEERYDIGIRLGDQIEKDMVAARIGPDLAMAMVASPLYLEQRKKPLTPQDLMHHSCINLRLPTRDALMPWELRKGSREIQVRVSGQLVFNSTYQMLDAALEGFGIAYLPWELAQGHVAAGRLVRVLEDWSPTYLGFHLYYPSRRQASRAIALVVEALKQEAIQ